MKPNQPNSPEPTAEPSPPPPLPDKNEEQAPPSDTQPTNEAPTEQQTSSDAAPVAQPAAESQNLTGPGSAAVTTENEATEPLAAPGLVGSEQPSGQPSFGAFGTANPPKSSGKKKKVLVVILAVVGLLGLAGAAYYFLVWNKPETIWKTAMIRSNMVSEKLIEYSEDNKNQKGGTVKGDFKFEGSFASDGSIEADFYESNSNFKADIGAVGSRITLEGRTIGVANSENPDVYLKATGIKDLASLGGPQYAQMATAYENKWLVIDHTLFDTLQKQAQPNTTNLKVTNDDVIKAAESIGKVNKEYLWTANQEKAVFRVAENVGKETQDGRSVYHFKVGLNKQNTKDYVNTMVDTLKDTKIGDMYGKDKFREAIGTDNIIKAIDGYKDSDTVDVYVDMGTRLIRNIRISDKENAKNYVEFGLHYTGGDELPFVVRIQNEEAGQASNAKFEFKLNSKTNVASINANADFPSMMGAADAKEKFSLKLTVTPSDKKVTVQKPEGAMSLNQLLGGLMSGIMAAPSASSGAERPLPNTRGI